MIPFVQTGEFQGSHSELLAQFGPEVFLILLVVPVLLPNLLVCISRGSRPCSVHFGVHLPSRQVLIVVRAKLELLKVVIFLKELINFLFLLLVLNDGSCHFALRTRCFTAFIGDSERVLRRVVVVRRHCFAQKNLVNFFSFFY